LLYILGGPDNTDNRLTSKAMVFDVGNLKWKTLPNMNHPRRSPGSFITQDGKYLYVVGGWMNYIERLDQRNPDYWEELEVELPDTISYACNLLTQALWNTKAVAWKSP
jgi:hypothetical protein